MWNAVNSSARMRQYGIYRDKCNVTGGRNVTLWFVSTISAAAPFFLRSQVCVIISALFIAHSQPCPAA